MIFCLLFRTVISYSTLRSSRPLIRRRWMYPVCEVLTAVSMSPTRPPIAWKKSSSGDNPEMYELSTKPRAPGVSSNLLKCGSVHLRTHMESAYRPHFEIIIIMLRSEPFEPAFTIMANRLLALRLSRPIFQYHFHIWL